MIEFKNVNKKYPTGVSAVRNASFKIENGDFVFLVGSSGSGKSTLIKMILKELDPTSGKIYIDGTDITKIKKKDVPYLRRKMGVVFQDFRLIADKTVYENVAFAMYMIGASPKHIKRQVPMVLSLVGIADEPTGNLDPQTAWDIMALFREISKRGTTIVMATHAQEIVDMMNEKVLEIQKGVIVRFERKGGYNSEI